MKIKTIQKIINSDLQLRLGCYGILFLISIVTFSNALATHDPYYFGPYFLSGIGENGHVLGANQLGQDIFSMLIYGARTSLVIATVSAMISGILGICIGGFAGFCGGRVDQIVSEIINGLMMIPVFFLLLLIIALFGNSLFNVIMVIGLTTWTGNAKLMRSQVLSLKERTFIVGARSIGENGFQILFRYILPNGMMPVIANTTLIMSNAILLEASLGFLGLGNPYVISWGQMIYAGKSYVGTAWWISVFPGLAIVVTVTILYLLSDGLNHVLNPKYINRKSG
ncbi:MAG: ABC transporter permease [Dethiosulfatibacter sp.]|nr:ABC transporter permease [Dethiosulfatibacter sp.]